MENQQILSIRMIEEGVAVVQINRPEAKNALNLELRKALFYAFDHLSKRDDVKSIVLTGGNDVFAAGADINDFKNASTIEVYLRHTEQYWQSLIYCPKPIIAAVNGYALGGGCELAMHADIIIAGTSAKFGQPEVKLGLMPGSGGTQRLLRAIGKYKTMLLVLTGQFISAKEAKDAGLVSEIVEDDLTITHALNIAKTIAKLSPIAVQQIKEVTRLGLDMSLESALVLERKSFQILFDTDDQKEGVNAFLEKREANFKGE
jgi:enoyl-CoA hydratase